MKINAPETSSIIFNVKGLWAIQISDKGIKFNREFFNTPHDFADIFIDILENKYNVKFIKKNAPERDEKC